MRSIGPIQALGTHWWLEYEEDSYHIESLHTWFSEKVLSFDYAYSRFKSDSLVTQLNKDGVLKNPPEEFVRMLERSLHWYKETGGVFNVLSANAQTAQGYGQSFSPKSEKLFGNPKEDLEIQTEQIVLKNGSLDFGGIGKGFLIDTIAKELKEEKNIPHFLINGGGDIYASTLPDGSPFVITAEHPTNPEMMIARIPLSHQAFAGSSTFKRAWKKEGVDKTHIISPHTKNTAIERGVYLISDSAEKADVLATTAVIQPTILMSYKDIPSCVFEHNSFSYITQSFEHYLV